MTVTVLVPTFRRPVDLARCLRALSAQTRPAAQIVVVRRAGDEETEAMLRDWPAAGMVVETVVVDVPGVVAAMNAGLVAARGEIVALTDDDAAPRPDWLAKIEAHFAADPTVGGVGGRDFLPPEMLHGAPDAAVVGMVQWHGRVVGGHHLGAGPARRVHVLKGVNSAYRAAALQPVGFDTRLRGAGAQVHWELSLGLALRRAGWKLVYDPAVAVDHFPAPRADTDSLHRGRFHAAALENMVYNETVVLSGHLPPVRRAVYWVWAILVGTRDAPGLAQAVRLALRRQPHLREWLRAAWCGRWNAIRDYSRGNTPSGSAP